MNSTLTKLSPYTLSLIGSSPPSLPHVPTLKELRDRSAKIPTPSGEGVPIGSPRSSQREGVNLPAYSFSNSPPPSYSSSGKGKGWAKLPSLGLQSLIPGEGRGKPRMKPSRSYSSDSKVSMGTSRIVQHWAKCI